MRIVNNTGIGVDTKFISDDGQDFGSDLKITDLNINISANNTVVVNAKSIASVIDLKIDEFNISMDVYSVVDFMNKNEKRALFERLRAELT